MPTVRVNGAELYYAEFGSGPETIVFSHGFLMNHTMFQGQIDALKDRYRIIAFDHRGHGQSENIKTNYNMYTLMDDAVGIIETLCDGPVHFMGMSTGGYVGVRLMVRRPNLLKSIVLMDTSGEAEAQDSLKQYNLLLTIVRFFGVRPVLGRSLALLMGDKFRTDPNRRAEYEKWLAYFHTLNKTAIYKFGQAIFHRDSVIEHLNNTDIPTLVIVGDKDLPTPVAKAERLASTIPNAELVIIPDAGHTAPLEEPAAVTAAIEAFLARIG